jgi:hypothetical protein
VRRDDAEAAVLAQATRRARELRAEGLPWGAADRQALDEVSRGYQSSLTKVARRRIRRRLRERRAWAS